MRDKPPTKEDIFFGKLEEIGSKSLKLGSKLATKHEPNAMKLLDAFSKWLDKKLMAT